jgi:hypothetical protein
MQIVVPTGEQGDDAHSDNGNTNPKRAVSEERGRRRDGRTIDVGLAQHTGPTGMTGACEAVDVVDTDDSARRRARRGSALIDVCFAEPTGEAGSADTRVRVDAIRAVKRAGRSARRRRALCNGGHSSTQSTFTSGPMQRTGVCKRARGRAYHRRRSGRVRPNSPLRRYRSSY